MKVSTVSQMRNLDRTAIETYGIAPELLMENAGQAVAAAILQRFGVKGKRFVIFCGLGNNGGDGFVVARKLHSDGGTVKVFVLGDPAKLKGAAGMNAEVVSRLPIAVEQLASAAAAGREVAHCDCVVDAILGTGITRDVRGLYRDVIELINGSGKTVFSVDIPSGVHGDTGQVMGAAVEADGTVTFGLPKIGNLLSPGIDLGGQLYVSHISFPPTMVTADTLQVEVNLPVELPPRRRASSQGDAGRALFVAGAASRVGAPYLAARSFLKAGGSWPHLVTPRSVAPSIASQGSGILVVPQVETASGGIAGQNEADLLELCAGMDMVVLGPGLPGSSQARQLARALTAQTDRPLLLAGAAITALGQNGALIGKRRAATILTLQLDDVSQLTGGSARDIDVDKIAVLQRTASELKATLVLQTTPSLIGRPDGRVFINLSGNPGMATAGSSDVLAGTIAAMVSLGLPPPSAARQGAFVHGLAGDLAAEDKGEDGLTAQDIQTALPRAMKLCREGLEATRRQRYAGARVI